MPANNFKCYWSLLCLDNLLVIKHEQWREMLFVWLNNLLKFVFLFRHSFAEHHSLVLLLHHGALNNPYNFSLRSIVSYLVAIQERNKLLLRREFRD